MGLKRKSCHAQFRSKVKPPLMWKEKGASKDFTYQGLTTCKEVDRSTKLSTNKQHSLSLNGNDQRIQPITEKESGEHTWYRNTHP